jgi:hypothetical protein
MFQLALVRHHTNLLSHIWLLFCALKCLAKNMLEDIAKSFIAFCWKTLFCFNITVGTWQTSMSVLVMVGLYYDPRQEK